MASVLHYDGPMRSAHRSSIPVSCLLFAAIVALLGATHCGGDAKTGVGATAGSSGSAGTVSVGTGGTGGSSGSGSAGASSACGGAHSTPVGRPTAPACAPTPVGTADAGARACSVDGDCADAGPDTHCLGGTCVFDPCLADSDCPSGQACRCSNQLRGDVGAGNSCVLTGCRVDADCGPSGTCSPDASGYCGAVDGYYCHTAADTCNSDADCCGGTRRCGYQQELGHWACTAIVVCSG